MDQNVFIPALRWGIGFLILLGVVIALWLGRLFFLPAVISLLLACVLWPVVNYLDHRWRMPRPLAGTFTMAGLVAVVCLGIAWGASAIQGLVQDIPQTAEGQQAAYKVLRDRVMALSPDFGRQLFPPDFQDSVFFKNIKPFVDEQTQRLPEYLKDVLGWSLLILFIVLFLCVEGEMLIRRSAEVFGPATGPDSRAALKVLREMARQVRNYLVWRTLINLGMTIFLGLIYTKLELKQPWTWAVLSGILTFVPYLGPVAAGLPALLDAFITQGTIPALIVFTIYAVVLLIEGYLIFPIVIGRHMEMNATTVMVGCLFWWVVWGEIGLFLAMPLLAGIKAICNNVADWQPWANLMGTERAEPAARGPAAGAPFDDRPLPSPHLSEIALQTPEEKRKAV